MQHSLKKNICKLPSDGTLRSEMDTDSISLHLPSELQYSCRYWAQHIIQSRDPISVLDVAFVFLEKHFLHWVEAMSILGVVSEVVGIINRLQKVLQEDKNSKISEFLHDARRFILKNMQIADTAPLQLYCSALVFAPEMSMIRSIFKRQIPYWMCRLPSVHKSWNAELQTLEGHKGPVVSVAFSSPDGKLVASGSMDRTVKLWDATTGALQQTLEGHPGPVWAVTFSPDGRLLALAGDQAVKLWDTATGALQHDLKGCSDHVWCVAFSPDGRLLASADDQAVKLWNTETGSVQQTLEGHSRWVHSVVFSSDGKLVASGGYHDQTVKLWDASTGALQQTLESGPATVISVAFSPDSKLLAAAGYEDQTIKLWDIASETLKQSLKGHLAPVRSVDFSPNGKLVLSGSEDQTIKLWDATTGVLLQTLEGHSGWILSVAFSPKDGMVASGGYHDDTIKLWDVSTRVPEQIPGGHLGDIHSVALSPGGKLVASGSADHTVKLWDAATGVLQHTLEGFRGSKISSRGSSVVFSPDGKLVAAWVQATTLISGTKQLAESTPHWTINVWDTATGVIQQSLDGHSGPVWSVLFSSDSKLVVSGSHDRTIKIWDAATGALQQTLVGHSGAVMSIALSSDDRLVASGSEDTTVKLWDIATGTLQQILEGHPSDDTDKILNRAVAISPDGRLVVSRTSGDIKVWNAVTGALEPTELVDERTMDPTRAQATVKVSVESQWVALQGEKVLWLPPEYRALCSAVEDGTLILGHTFGRVSFMEFNLQ